MKRQIQRFKQITHTYTCAYICRHTRTLLRSLTHSLSLSLSLRLSYFHIFCHFFLCCILCTRVSLLFSSLLNTYCLSFSVSFSLYWFKDDFSLYLSPPFLHTHLSQLRHSLFPRCLFHWFAVIDSLRRKGRMASSWNGRVDDFGNTTLSANTHMHAHR